MRRYESYKDSGVEWLGEVPSQWEVKKMKFLFKDTSIKNKPDETLLSVTQNRGVIPRDWLEERTVMPSGSLETFKFIEKDDFAISLRSFEGGLEICHHDGIISPAYTVLKYNKKLLNNGYYKYLFKCQRFISEMQTSIVGIREGKNISYEELKYSFIPIPQTNEQQKIAQFLDDKTAKIDQAVDLAEKQIALLKEHKQILIQNAVTRGLHPDVPLKDSGVEWIGQVPEHWEVKKIKHVTSKIGSGITPLGGGSNYIDGGIPLLRSQNIHFDRIDLNDVARISEFTHNSMKNSKVRKGDVLLNITGGSLGRCFYVDSNEEMNVNQHVCIIRPNKKINTIFLNMLLASEIGQKQIWFFQQGGGREGLNFQAIKNFYLPLPDLEEQQKIAIYLDKQAAKIDQAIALKKAHIEKLKEYKSVLINDVVTGKVRV